MLYQKSPETRKIEIITRETIWNTQSTELLSIGNFIKDNQENLELDVDEKFAIIIGKCDSEFIRTIEAKEKLLTMKSLSFDGDKQHNNDSDNEEKIDNNKGEDIVQTIHGEANQELQMQQKLKPSSFAYPPSRASNKIAPLQEEGEGSMSAIEDNELLAINSRKYQVNDSNDIV
jgi:hypothetical protein